MDRAAHYRNQQGDDTVTDEPTPSLLTFLLAYGGFFAVSLLLFLARRGHYVTAQQHYLPDVVEDDGEYHD